MTDLFTTLIPSTWRAKRIPALPNRTAQGGTTQRLRVAWLLLTLMLCGLTLSGCGDVGDTLWDLFSTGNGEAEAQEDTERRIQTFVIRTETFEIEVDNDDDATPDLQLVDGATIYTMQTDGIVRFDTSDGSDRNFVVEPNDQIIERPGADGNGTVTIIRVD